MTSLQDLTLEQAAEFMLDHRDDEPMERAEAEYRTGIIRNNLNEARLHLWKINKREGWKALGYTSMRQYIIHEFPVYGTTGQAYRQLAAAEVEAIALPDGQVGALPENALRPLFPYRKDPETLHTLVAIAQRVAGEERMTNAHVQATVDVMEEAISTGLLTDDEGEQTEVWARLEHQVMAVMAERTKVHKEHVRGALAVRTNGKKKHYLVDVDITVYRIDETEIYLQSMDGTVNVTISGNPEAMQVGQTVTCRLLADDVP